MKVFKNEFIQCKNDKKIVQYTKIIFQKVFFRKCKKNSPYSKLFERLSLNI